MAIDTEPQVSEPTYPGCGSRRIAPGTIRSDGGGALSLLEMVSYPTLKAEQPAWFCVGCGLLWTTAADLGEARRQIRAYGTAGLRARTLDVTESLPRPAAAPGSGRHSFRLPSDHHGSPAED